jgi:hypothetical protein
MADMCMQSQQDFESAKEALTWAGAPREGCPYSRCCKGSKDGLARIQESIMPLIAALVLQMQLEKEVADRKVKQQ